MLPNLITAMRLVLLAPIMLLVAQPGNVAAARWALYLFVVAAVSDLLDGLVARKMNCVTAIGTFFDPLVDKILANVLLVALCSSAPDVVNPWLVSLLLAREFAVQGFRSMAPCKGVVIRTRRLNKLKFVFQSLCIAAALGGAAFPGLQDDLRPVVPACLWMAVVAGMVSAAQMFWQNRDLWERPNAEMETR